MVRPAGGGELAGEKPADWSLALCGGGYERDPARMTITGRQADQRHLARATVAMPAS